MNLNLLCEQMLKGDKTALSRLMSFVENRPELAPQLFLNLKERLGRAQVLGVTGPPGAGKSTLVDCLVKEYRRQGKGVGVVAIDPSSPFSGGALLGDRIRMMDHCEDAEVFIRSLGTRGAHGGLSHATRNIVRLFDAFGKEIIIVETVGVGQTELDVLDIAHTTVVVLTPESGDTIQTLKAGLLEAADIFVVNKSDREGAGKIELELKTMIEIGRVMHVGPADWKIPVLKAQASEGKGVLEITEWAFKHYQALQHSEAWVKKQIRANTEEFESLFIQHLRKKMQQLLQNSPQFAAIYEKVKEGKQNAYEAFLEFQKIS